MTLIQRAIKIADLFSGYGNPTNDYRREREAIVSELEAYALEKVRQVIDGWEETKAIREARAKGIEEAASLVQRFRWVDDRDLEVTDLLAHKIRALKVK